MINLIKENSFSLRKFKYSGTAFTKENALKVIRQVFLEPILILGGDVYELNDDLLIPLSDIPKKTEESGKSIFQPPANKVR